MEWLKEVWNNLIGYLGFDEESSTLAVVMAAVILLVLALCRKRIEQWWSEKREKTPQGLFWPPGTNVLGKKNPPSAVLKPFNGAIPLFGRENELEQLNDFFLQKEVPISIWAIVGEGGMGKTKLAYKAVSSFRHTNPGWDALWWGANNVQYDPETRLHWTDNAYPRNLIVVVDSVGSLADAFAAELRKLSPERENRLRILLTERENVQDGTQDGKNPLWLDRLLGFPETNADTELAHFFYGYDKTNTFTSGSFLTLKKLNQDALRKILQIFHSEDYDEENKMLNKWASGSTLLFLVAAMLQDRANAPQNPGEALDYCLQIEEEHRQQLCGPELAGSVRLLLVYATLVGQWTVRDAVPETFGLPEAAEAVKKALDKSKPRRLLDNLGGSSRNYTMNRFTPDYFGEYFALQELERLKNRDGDEALKNLLHTLWEQEKTREGYADFLLRAIEDHPEQELLREAVECQEDALEKAELLTLLGDKLLYWGRYKNAADLYEQALHIREKLLDKDDPLVAESYNNLGAAYRGLGDYKEAIKQYEKALAIYRDKYGENHPHTAMSYSSLGSAYRNLGDYPKAKEQHEQALAIRERVLGKNHPATAMSYNGLGNAYYGLGDYNKAKELHEQALAIQLRVLGENHPATAMSYNNLGNAYDDLGNYNKAIELHEQALAIQLRVLGKNHPDTATSYGNLGAAYDGLGDYPKAIEQYEQALAIQLRVLGKNHPDTASSYNNLGVAYGGLGDYNKAIELHEQALAIRERILGENHPDTAISYYNLGADYYDLRQYPEAMNNFRSAFSIFLSTIGPDHPYTRGSARNIATCAEAMHDTSTAERYRHFAEHGEFPDTP